MNKKGQIWVETVIYTLIGLAIIGLVLAAALPKINERKDSIAIEQSIEVLRAIDNKISQVQAAVGNRRVVNLKISKGALIVDMDADEISWIIDSSFVYSEIESVISLGRLNVTTTGFDPYEVELVMGYSVDIRFDNATTGVKRIGSAPTSYEFVIENAGVTDGGNIIIDLKAN